MRSSCSRRRSARRPSLAPVRYGDRPDAADRVIRARIGDSTRSAVARAMWKGAIQFGLVTIPVKLYLATESKGISFNMLHKTTCRASR